MFLVFLLTPFPYSDWNKLICVGGKKKKITLFTYLNILYHRSDVLSFKIYISIYLGSLKETQTLDKLPLN